MVSPHYIPEPGQSDHRLRGWCPGAWRPMASGDGLIVRVRPRLARLSHLQLLGLCQAAQRCGNGLIDLTNRANLQLRGVSDATLDPLLERLARLDLLDASPELERRRNVLVTPDWQSGDDSHRLALTLLQRLHEVPALPAKMGIAIDAGAAPLVARESADFRIERGTSGRLLLRADGRARGTPLDSVEDAIDALLRLMHWFLDSGGDQARRMRHWHAPLPAWAPEEEAPRMELSPLMLGPHALGVVCGLPFGQIEAAQLAALLADTPVHAVRVTPWRQLLLEGIQALPAAGGLLSDNADPLLRTHACPGVPRCASATVETRQLARQLAPCVKGSLHVSGCSKGCACPSTTDVCLTGRTGHYDIAYGARADDAPEAMHLSAADVLSSFGVS